MISSSNPPRKRPGYRWVWREGCRCVTCPWKQDGCRGEDMPHWREVKE